MRYVLDTHALIWHLSGDKRLGEKARQVLDNSEALLVVPALVIAEAKHAADRKRVPVPFEQVLQALLSSTRIYVFPLDIYTVNYLESKLDIHDSIIVATALYCKDFFEDDVSIITKDLDITQLSPVPIVW